ncbi:MAG: YhcH/YjgK/YiaL family protein [Bacteroidaceae bacterium]|jgi:YhcH/YjgK/YiaL family protein|nr:YhcH/YjgK/YiaL family protein [Bacteroidaceae bacterium]
MILTNLQSTDRIENLHPLFKKLFDYVKTHDLLKAPLGRIVLDGDNLFINNDEAICRSVDEQVMEIHRKYIDVQIVLEGEESVGWKPLNEIQHISKAYDEVLDFELSDDKPSTYFHVTPGQIYILFPEDPHAPIIGEGKIRKAIGKVKVLP